MNRASSSHLRRGEGATNDDDRFFNGRPISLRSSSKLSELSTFGILALEARVVVTEVVDRVKDPYLKLGLLVVLMILGLTVGTVDTTRRMGRLLGVGRERLRKNVLLVVDAFVVGAFVVVVVVVEVVVVVVVVVVGFRGFCFFFSIENKMNISGYQYHRDF